MLKIYQYTLSDPVNFEGKGLHSGKKVSIKVLPAKSDTGIIFKRTDLAEKNLIKANYRNVSSAKLCTTLENKHGVKVSTVEHLLAALYLSEIDNALIEINNEEVPIMDGSAKIFMETLQKAKIKKLNKRRKYLKVTDYFEFNDGGRKISIESNGSLEVQFQLNYINEIIGKQKRSINFQTENLDEVVEARTFCLYEDIEKIKKMGLAKGGSLDNAIVVGKDKVLNEGGLRNEKEFVNHKILDLAGDFMLSGHRILGKVNCYQGGHELTNMFLKKLLSSKSKTTILELKDIIITKKPSSDHQVKIAVNA